jgi:HKD family nuclease
MRIDPSIFLSRTKDISSDAIAFGDQLKESIKDANRIAIFSGFYSTSYILELLKEVPKKNRARAKVDLVFGTIGRHALILETESLRKLQADLKAEGFRQASIKIFSPQNVHFHVKLYHFIRGTQPEWFIGSANASDSIEGSRHELMVRVHGRHPNLSQYVKEVIQLSRPINEPEGESPVYDLRSFFLTGFLCYRPTDRMGLTFQAYNISPEQRKRLKEKLLQDNKIPYASPNAEGFGFNLEEAVTGSVDLGGLEAQVAADPVRMKFRHVSIETSYGYWMPPPFAKQAQEVSEQSEAVVEKQYLKMGSQLQAISDLALEEKLKEHVAGLQSFFSEVEVELKSSYKELFRKFVSVRRSWLGNREQIKRLSRRLHFARMPDIWNDQIAIRDFEDSFFEGIAAKLSLPGNIPRIHRLLREKAWPGINDATPQELKDRLQEYITKNGWNVHDWD